MYLLLFLILQQMKIQFNFVKIYNLWEMYINTKTEVKSNVFNLRNIYFINYYFIWRKQNNINETSLLTY